MSDDHIDPATVELKMNDRLLFSLKQRQRSNLDELEAAAMVTAFWDLASTIEEDQLDRPVHEVLAESDYGFEFDTDNRRSDE